VWGPARGLAIDECTCNLDFYNPLKNSTGGAAGQILPATSSTRTLNPRSLS